MNDHPYVPPGLHRPNLPARSRDAAVEPGVDGTAERLTAADERALAGAVARGDAAARDRLIRANVGLVPIIARLYLGRGLSIGDLVGEGNLGLIRAAQDFDPGFGVRFSTYAAHWIR
jgi:DNA-directed RNA polymerase sigma subunit (sigma70/sigma32)